MKKTQILIVDFGCQYTLVIRRTLSELGYQSYVISPEKVSEYLEEHSPKAVILSGSNASVYDENAPTIPRDLLEGNYFVLGICYGMQLISYLLDTLSVIRGDEKQKGYGGVQVKQYTRSVLFEGLTHEFRVWASHGDVVARVPAGFTITALSEQGTSQVIEGMQSETNKIFGVQFHPEVIQTEDNNHILKNFVELAGCHIDWKPDQTIEFIQSEALEAIGEGKALLGVSGGVDSMTLARILSPKLKNRLFACIIDHGGMRKHEVADVCEVAKIAGIDLRVIDASDYFLETIGDAVDPEEKRKRFQKAYAKTFEKIIVEEKITHMIQGTLATDLIESAHAGKSSHIKTHHNVGLAFSIPEIMPFRNLFKYEVRAIAHTLGLDKAIAERKPFPGPGEYLRILGIPVTKKLLEVVSWADDAITEILKTENCYDDISQLVIALNGVETVGIKGSARSLSYAIVVRPVKSSDYMTTKAFYIPESVMELVTNEVTKHELINRVWWDYTPKPPATTEFQ